MASNRRYPKQCWLPAFNRRMEKQGLASLVLRLPSALERSHKYAFNKESVDAFFRDLESAYARAGIASQEDAWRVINMAETGVQGDQESKLRVLAPRGTKRVQMTVSSERKHVTMINAISAAGKAFRPMLVYPNTALSPEYTENVLLKKDPGLKIGRSEKGWIDSALFVEFLEDLKSQLPAERRDARIVLIVDGHSSHTTIEAVEWSRFPRTPPTKCSLWTSSATRLSKMRSGMRSRNGRARD
ncbi:mitochondrial rve superfamily member [Andalucia godoyi]|uniref:Mitochondrial rve superfamily member n=1 Tax=Andalucia godoyi TaxID=505711 RepID=A0A8K0F491_ANDGO|nr:mitochondrial rve superfamily member [Andalucia godoyi]|eukprot:ANDGO_01327.mRNA.1 mitochondrial rve superfamily member